MSFAGASISSALDHPLFSDSIAAAQHGDFSTAFKGIAALIDDEEQETAGSPIKRSIRPTSVPLCSTLEFAQSLPSMHNVLAASASGSNTPIVWTRPSAIRLAKQRASMQMQMMNSARKPRPTPYDRATGAAAAAATVSSTAAAPASPASPSAPSVAPSSDYKPVRHERRRGFKPASSTAAASAAAAAARLSCDSGLLPLAPRRSRSGGSPSDGSGGGSSMNDENDLESRATNTLELADTHSSGEATMLLRMWKM